MTYYITKYALTAGIKAYPDDQVKKISDSMIDVKKPYSSYYHGHGKEWHTDLGAAIARADEMRRNKIASMKKSIAKLEKLNFVKQTVQGNVE